MLIKVTTGETVLHEVETDAVEIHMVGDGWKELGTFPTIVSAPADPPPVTPPPPAPTPTGLGPFYKPTSVADLQQALQAALTAGKMLFLYPDRYDIDQPLVFNVPACTEWAGDSAPGSPNSKTSGLWAYGSQFDWRGPGGQRMLTFDAQGENGNLRILGLSAYGNGYFSAPAASFVTLRGYSGKAIRNAVLADMAFYHFDVGIELVGEVFESRLRNLDGSYCRTAGITLEHSGNEVMSNIFIDSPSFRQGHANVGAAKGIWAKGSVNSVLVSNGNFISLDGPAIHGTSGIKRISHCSFENCGNTNGAAVEIDADTFGMAFVHNDASNTGGQMPYVLDYRADGSKLILADGSRYACDLRKP